MLMYSTNHSQGLLHYVEQKCDVTDNREERTHAPFRRHTPTLIKYKSWKMLSLYKKYSSPYNGLYFHFCLSPTKSYHLRTVLESRLRRWEKVNIYYRVQTVISRELVAFSICYLVDERCQRSTVLFVLLIIFVIFGVFFLWNNRSLLFCLNSYFLLLVYNTKAIA